MFTENPRTDIASRKKMPKGDLFRLVKDPRSGELILDETGDMPGRGVYIEKSLAAIELAIKKHRFDRFGGLSEAAYERMKGALLHD
ncbi:MAG: DUF448 domain-containing protein [Bacilli bacterium]|nr:DUF448 domain-containing protein [Bacilli bacterium]